MCSSDASRWTVRRRSNELSSVRESISGGGASVQLQDELALLTDDERREFAAPVTQQISPEETLAMKADLILPWNKMRIMRRPPVWTYPCSTSASLVFSTVRGPRRLGVQPPVITAYTSCKKIVHSKSLTTFYSQDVELGEKQLLFPGKTSLYSEALGEIGPPLRHEKRPCNSPHVQEPVELYIVA